MAVRIEGTYINIIKTTYDKPTANFILNGRKLKTLSLRLGIVLERPLLELSFNIVLEFLTIAIGKEKGMKVSKLERKK